MRFLRLTLLLSVGALAWAAPVGSPGSTPEGANPVCDDGSWRAPAPPVEVAAPGCRPPAETFPVRPADAPSGTEFGARVAGLSDHERYAAAREQVLAGNVPPFLRTLVPVTLTRPAGSTGSAQEVTVFVTPDYLSVGDDQDYLPVPLDFLTAAAVARDLGFALPTSRIVDAVYAEAAVRLRPIPLPAGPEMRSMAYVLQHRDLVQAARAGQAPGLLVAGNQKDVVLTGALRSQPGREAIYGWHRPDGRPIQPLSLVHGATYADYSHGIRLVDATVIVDGVPRPYLDALADPDVAPLLSQEGPIPDAAALMRPGSVRGG